jgi:hypothetical protein
MTTDRALDLALEALEKLQWSLEQADCSTGYCCCGSSVDGHTFGDGHSPVDEGEYYQSNALEYARKAITAIKQALAAPDLQADLVKANAQAEHFEREWYLRGDELEATNRQVEILSDALAESRRQRQWVGLTDEQIDLFINGRGDEDDDDYLEPTGDGFGLTDADLVKLVRRAEAKLRSENT